MKFPWTHTPDPTPGRCVIVDISAIVRETRKTINDLNDTGGFSVGNRLADSLGAMLRNLDTSRDSEPEPEGKPEMAEDWSR
jgi:hypothetical protein